MTRPKQPSSQPVDQGPARALIYLRVSTKEQAGRGGEAEGYSIPTQREACQRKAEALHAMIVDEFVDAGESARSADRPELQRLLKVIDAGDIDYVIVHKIDRLARNRLDDLTISLAFEEAGVQLVSCSENIDRTPSGRLTHGLMALIAEWYSSNLSAEVQSKTLAKVRSGGTVGKAAIGYLNVRLRENGREIRTVEVDAERAPLVQWAFEAYATGEWSTGALAEELDARGLRTIPTARFAEKPLSKSAVHRMLRNRYYIGKVTWQGVEYDGTHPPLVSRQLFDRVRSLLEAHNYAGEKQSVHAHYLKGSVFCGRCGFRMIVSHNKNRWGTVYPYFICLGRQQKRSACEQKAVLIEDVERQVEAKWKHVTIDSDYAELLRRLITDELGEQQGRVARERERTRRRLHRLNEQRQKLLQAHYADKIPLDLFGAEQQRITREMDAARDRLDRVSVTHDHMVDTLNRCLQLVTDCGLAYSAAPPEERRQMNQALFERFEITEEGVIQAELTPTFAVLLRPDLVVERQAEDAAPKATVPSEHRNTDWIEGWPVPLWLGDLWHWMKTKKPVRRGTGVVRAARSGNAFPYGWGLNMNYVVRPQGLEP